MSASGAPMMGIEEEFLLVHPATRAPEPVAPKVVARAAAALGDRVGGEFSQSQIEIRTSPAADACWLHEELLALRAGVAAAATAEDVRVCASGTPVVAAHEPAPVGDHPRYRAGIKHYGAMLEDFIVCGMHTHIYLPDRELAVLVSNHLRPWLPLLVALSANSPFHEGHDTGYADWRAVIRSRFPCLGPPPYAESLRHHEELAIAMAESQAMLDANTPFWDIRPNPRLPTLEVRSMDVTAGLDDTLALAVLVRALVTTATAAVLRGNPGPRPPSELLRSAYWRAARDGWSGSGVDALSGRILPTSVQIGRLLDHVRAALEEHGDVDLVLAFLRRLRTRGTGAERQRASAARHGTLTGVVDDLVHLTAAASP